MSYHIQNLINIYDIFSHSPNKDAALWFKNIVKLLQREHFYKIY